jgi:hypothetical protein
MTLASQLVVINLPKEKEGNIYLRLTKYYVMNIYGYCLYKSEFS